MVRFVADVPLRVKLIAAMLALVTMALVVDRRRQRPGHAQLPVRPHRRPARRNGRAVGGSASRPRLRTGPDLPNIRWSPSTQTAPRADRRRAASSQGEPADELRPCRPGPSTAQLGTPYTRARRDADDALADAGRRSWPTATVPGRRREPGRCRQHGRRPGRRRAGVGAGVLSCSPASASPSSGPACTRCGDIERDRGRDRRRRPHPARRPEAARDGDRPPRRARSTRCSPRSSGVRGERAASEDRMRQFVADASHELRTPLTTIRGFAELYRQGAADEPEEPPRLHAADRGRGRAHGPARRGPAAAGPARPGAPARSRPGRPAGDRQRRGRGRPRRRARPPDRRCEMRARRADRGRRRRGPAAPGRRQPRDQRAHAHPGRHAGPRAAAPRRRRRAHRGRRRRPGPVARSRRERVFERFYRVDKARTRRAAGSDAGGHPAQRHRARPRDRRRARRRAPRDRLRLQHAGRWRDVPSAASAHSRFPAGYSGLQAAVAKLKS